MPGRSTGFVIVLITICLFLSHSPSDAQTAVQEGNAPQKKGHTVELGDTWELLAWRYNVGAADLVNANGTINPQRQPAVGSSILVPDSTPKNGHLLRPTAGGSLELAAQNGRNPWTASLQNRLPHPYTPLMYTQMVLPGGHKPPHELPAGLEYLALAPGPITPGSAFALRATMAEADALAPGFSLEEQPLVVSRQGQNIIALGATGSFYPPGQHLLTIRAGEKPLWEQPLTISDRQWTWEEVYFTNPAVLDPEALRLERERLQALWDELTPQALWQGKFESPIEDFVEVSSYYGARRSVNNGPYNSYHEGTDYSAYKGSEVRAPAAGNVVLAEELAIRGGAVIIDHGLGIHSGYYHMSAVHVRPGQFVEAGDLIGEVGSTGRSTGNHLHWDLLIGRTWIDGLAWLERGIDTWLSPAPVLDHRLPTAP